MKLRHDSCTSFLDIPKKKKKERKEGSKKHTARSAVLPRWADSYRQMAGSNPGRPTSVQIDARLGVRRTKPRGQAAPARRSRTFAHPQIPNCNPIWLRVHSPSRPGRPSPSLASLRVLAKEVLPNETQLAQYYGRAFFAPVG